MVYILMRDDVQTTENKNAPERSENRAYRYIRAFIRYIHVRSMFSPKKIRGYIRIYEIRFTESSESSITKKTIDEGARNEQ